MAKDKKSVEIVNESFNLFIDKISLIILDTFLEEHQGLGNENNFETS